MHIIDVDILRKKTLQYLSDTPSASLKIFANDIGVPNKAIKLFLSANFPVRTETLIKIETFLNRKMSSEETTKVCSSNVLIKRDATTATIEDREKILTKTVEYFKNNPCDLKKITTKIGVSESIMLRVLQLDTTLNDIILLKINTFLTDNPLPKIDHKPLVVKKVSKPESIIKAPISVDIEQERKEISQRIMLYQKNNKYTINKLAVLSKIGSFTIVRLLRENATIRISTINKMNRFLDSSTLNIEHPVNIEQERKEIRQRIMLYQKNNKCDINKLAILSKMGCSTIVRLLRENATVRTSTIDKMHRFLDSGILNIKHPVNIEHPVNIKHPVNIEQERKEIRQRIMLYRQNNKCSIEDLAVLSKMGSFTIARLLRENATIRISTINKMHRFLDSEFTNK